LALEKIEEEDEDVDMVSQKSRMSLISIKSVGERASLIDSLIGRADPTNQMPHEEASSSPTSVVAVRHDDNKSDDCVN